MTHKHEYHSLSTHHWWVLVQIVLHRSWVRGVLRSNITTVYKPDVQLALSYLRDTHNQTKREPVSNRLSVNSLQERVRLRDGLKELGHGGLWRKGNFFPVSICGKPPFLSSSAFNIIASSRRFPRLIESLSKDDGNGIDNARKQWSDWLNEEK